MARPTTVCILMVLFIHSSKVQSQVLDNYFASIKDAISSWRHYFHTGMEGLAKLAQTIETIEQFVDATIEEDCKPFVCPSGMVRVSNPNHIPRSNGCGSFGFEWKEDKLPHKELKECCNEHDFCYDQCGADKDMCDLYFKKCLYRVCSMKEDDLTLLELKACKGTAKVMYTGTLAMGCKAFQDAQRQACYCLDREEF